MGGITGVYAYNKKENNKFRFVEQALNSIKHRGCKSNLTQINEFTILAEISNNNNERIIQDETKKYTLAFCGNVYNIEHLKQLLEKKSINTYDVCELKIILYLLIAEKENCLKEIEGNFCLAFYDTENNELLVARDKLGINPLVFYKNNDYFIFASETKALLEYEIPKEINFNSVYFYFKLNYIPTNLSIIKNIEKLKAGHYIKISNKHFVYKPFYTPPIYEISKISYSDAMKQCSNLIKVAIEKRIQPKNNIAFFLSGGIDSSVITAVASELIGKINTFSIGYSNNTVYDETYYAKLVSKKFNTNHTVFQINNKDYIEHIYNVLEAIDEPFADSSSIPFYILSKFVKQHAEVAFSGDGADEIFAGYNKHMAHYKIVNPKIYENIASNLNFLWKIMPQSRNDKLSNLFRQLNKFSEGKKLSPKERYFAWASFSDNLHCKKLIKTQYINELEIEEEKNTILKHIKSQNELIEIIYSDVNLVLQNDMLVKADLMSSHNGLEIKSPFLDNKLFDFALQLPIEYKINSTIKKRILQDAYKEVLPNELYNRPKHGFEVPLLEIFKTELWHTFDNTFLNKEFIEQQNIFNYYYIQELKQKLFSQNIGDVPMQIWALIVFQYWWKKHFN